MKHNERFMSKRGVLRLIGLELLFRTGQDRVGKSVLQLRFLLRPLVQQAEITIAGINVRGL